jgi:hypothetical protein
LVRTVQYFNSRNQRRRSQTAQSPRSSHHLKVTPHPKHVGAMEGVMHDAGRYRDMAAKCLRAAQEACQPHYRKLQLSMAVSWLSLARQDEVMDDLLASWDTAEPTDRLAPPRT